MGQTFAELKPTFKTGNFIGQTRNYGYLLREMHGFGPENPTLCREVILLVSSVPRGVFPPETNEQIRAIEFMLDKKYNQALEIWSTLHQQFAVKGKDAAHIAGCLYRKAQCFIALGMKKQAGKCI